MGPAKSAPQSSLENNKRASSPKPLLPPGCETPGHPPCPKTIAAPARPCCPQGAPNPCRRLGSWHEAPIVRLPPSPGFFHTVTGQPQRSPPGHSQGLLGICPRPWAAGEGLAQAYCLCPSSPPDRRGAHCPKAICHTPASPYSPRRRGHCRGRS